MARLLKGTSVCALFLLLVMCFPDISISEEGQEKGKFKKKSEQYEGVRSTRNTITAKPGYKLEVRSVQMRDGSIKDFVIVKNPKGKVTGNFACGCTKDGGCKVKGNSTSTSITCVSVGCEGCCDMEFTVDPPPAPDP